MTGDFNDNVLAIAAASGWYVVDRDDDRCPVVVFAVVEEPVEGGGTARIVTPMIAAPDGDVEVPSFPFELRHVDELQPRRWPSR